jgi:hypothetical protein
LIKIRELNSSLSLDSEEDEEAEETYFLEGEEKGCINAMKLKQKFKVQIFKESYKIKA